MTRTEFVERLEQQMREGSVIYKTGTVEIAPEPALTVIEGIEIARVGQEWPSMQGPFTLTQEHILSVIASQSDPAIKSPRVKLGHEDERFTPDGPGIFDGDPVFGKFVNLRTNETKTSLIGDITGVPKWLAEVAPYAWPSRSGEWLPDWDNHGTARTKWPMVLTAVALLGVELPAISTIEDLPALFTAEGPEGVKVVVDGAKIRAASRKEPMAKPRKTSVGTDAITRSYYDDFAQGDRYWWWIVDLYIDPTAVIAVDDDTGDMYYVPYTIDGDNVTWGEPVAVKEQYIAADDGKVLAKARTAAHYKTAAASRPADRVKTNAGGSMTKEQIIALRQRLGLTEDQLPDDATDEQIDAALAAPEEAEEATETDEEAAEEQPTEEPANEAPAEEPAEPVTTKNGGGETVTVSKAVWDETQKRLTSLESKDVQREKDAAKDRRDTKVRTSIREGRIAPAEHDHYRTMMDIDEQGTTKLLDSLTPGKVPVNERGINTSTETTDAGLGTGLLPELNRKD